MAKQRAAAIGKGLELGCRLGEEQQLNWPRPTLEAMARLLAAQIPFCCGAIQNIAQNGQTTLVGHTAAICQHRGAHNSEAQTSANSSQYESIVHFSYHFCTNSSLILLPFIPQIIRKQSKTESMLSSAEPQQQQAMPFGNGVKNEEEEAVGSPMSPKSSSFGSSTGASASDEHHQNRHTIAGEFPIKSIEFKIRTLSVFFIPNQYAN